MKKLLTTTMAIAMLAATPSAFAALLYSYEAGPGNFGNGSLDADKRSYNSITASYHSKGFLSFGTDFGDARADGFWLVINNGPNPKYHRGELAIFYGHLGSKRLYAYEYDGNNSPNSWNTLGNQLEYFGNVIQRDDESFNFRIDVRDLNSRTDIGPNWTGAQFGEQVGIWYHPTWGTKMPHPFGFSYKKQGWFDVANRTTTVTEVPEPGTIALFGSALLGLFGLRRKRLA